MKKILLITHQTSKTGAPLSILLILKEILSKKKTLKLDVLALSCQEGLKKDFMNLACNFYYPEKYIGYKKTLYELILSIIGKLNYTSELNIIEHQIQKNNYDLIYANTIVSLPMAVKLKNKLKCKLICHIHELEYAIEECLPEFENYIPFVDKYIAPSVLNKKLLVEKFKINKDKIKVIRETSLVPPENFTFDINENVFNVYMCGTANWRKGEDLFIQLANKTISIDTTINFYWIGNQSKEIEHRTISELKKIKSCNNIHFIGEQENIYDTLKKMDCFVLTSREDPFPLAAIEAGMVGLPIICFNKGNGISEVLLDQDLVIDYLNIEKMSDKIIELKKNKEKIKEISKNNLNIFQTFNPEQISNLVLQEIEELYDV